MDKKLSTICYFGIYEPVAPRDKVYLAGLKKLGVAVFECVDNAPGLSKFFNLYKKHREFSGSYDVLWVGYLSAMVVPLAWLLTQKKIVFNALSSWYENAVIDRGLYAKFSPKAVAVWIIDFLAFHLADVVFVESVSQKKYISKQFKVRGSKIKVVYTSTDPDIFFPDSGVKKAERFTVLFRGMFAPATGVEFVLESAKILLNKPVDFVIIGWGPELFKVKKMIADYGLSNVTLITQFLEPKVLRERMLSAHVMLGQFGNHPRLDRTIQNKTFEAMALGMPYITRDSASNRELLRDGENTLFVRSADSKDIAEKIMYLEQNPDILRRLGEEARKTYEEHLTPAILGSIVSSVVSKL